MQNTSENSMYIKKLSGHSGCSVMLMKSASHGFYVRKISSSLAYNARLKRQATKQLLFFKNNKLENISTPQIYSHGYINNLFFFDMEYISGENFCNALKYIPTTSISYYIQNFIFYIQSLPVTSTANAEIIFQKKLNTLRTSIETTTPLIQKAFSALESFDFSAIPQTPCCGDLTLENIIITRSGKIYLIDFLDSFFNSFYIDIAKLLQDIHLGWSYRHSPKNINIEVRLLIFRTLLEKTLLTSKMNIDINAIYHILLLNILRIIPYTSDLTTKNFLEKSIATTLSTLRSIE